MDWLESFKNSELISKITASTIMLGTLYAIFFYDGHEILVNGAKEIVLIILGGAVVSLFKK